MVYFQEFPRKNFIIVSFFCCGAHPRFQEVSYAEVDHLCSFHFVLMPEGPKERCKGDWPGLPTAICGSRAFRPGGFAPARTTLRGAVMEAPLALLPTADELRLVEYILCTGVKCP